MSLKAAAQAWDVSKETLNQVNARIHDGVSDDHLTTRADNYVSHIKNMFPYVNFDFSDAMEIGSGVGFLMEAVARAAPPACRITGLDISESMIGAARARLGEKSNFSFAHYDGVTMPFADESFDFIYSFAALQHVPKPFVYNLFFEVQRTLRANGVAILHFMPFSLLPAQEKDWPWRDEIKNQISEAAGPHWHHYYAKEELETVLHVTGFEHVDIAQDVYACVGKRPIEVGDHHSKVKNERRTLVPDAILRFARRVFARA